MIMTCCIQTFPNISKQIQTFPNKSKLGNMTFPNIGMVIFPIGMVVFPSFGNFGMDDILSSDVDDVISVC